MWSTTDPPSWSAVQQRPLAAATRTRQSKPGPSLPAAMDPVTHDRPPFAAFSIVKTTMDPDDIPAEVWQEIFSFVSRSTDILNVMLASKRFYMLALRTLHHTVVWRHPADVAQSMPFWRDYPGMHLAVDAFVCSVPAPLPSGSASRGVVDFTTPDDCSGRWKHLTPAVYDDVVTRMMSFKQLSSVTFTELQLGYRHFKLIYDLPLLRTLRVEKCGVQFGRFLNIFDPSTLPITHLTMRNLRRLEHEFIGDGGAGDNAYALLSLARAPNLHTLVVDPSAEVFKYVFGPGGGPAIPPAAAVWAAGQLLLPAAYPPPPHLQCLYIERKRQLGPPMGRAVLPPQGQPPVLHNGWGMPLGQPPVIHNGWGVPGGMQIWGNGHPGHVHVHVDGFPEAALFSFLQRCPTLTTYGTYHCATQNTQLPAGVLPALRAYTGPVGTLFGVVGNGRPIRALRLTNCTGQEVAGLQERERGTIGFGGGVAPLPNTVTGHREGLPALASVAGVLQDLEELDLEFRAWDDEIMHAIVGFFPKLHSLKITYEAGGPSETVLVAMGPDLLLSLAHLQTLHIYARALLAAPVNANGYDSDEEVERALRHPLSLFDDTFDTLEDELRELVIPWNRYCPALREVQLTAEYKLLRGYEGGKWSLQRVGKGESESEFV